MIKIYLASGWFNEKQMLEVQTIEKMLSSLTDVKLYSPRKEASCPPTAPEDVKKKVFESNCMHIQTSDLVIVNTRDKDLGTIFEAGYSYSCGIPIMYFAQGLEGPFNLMLAKSGIAVAKSFNGLAMHVLNFLSDKDYVSTFNGDIE